MEKKSTNLIPDQESVTKVYHSIKNIIEKARKKSYQAVNFAMVKAYWDIGRVIVEEEQQGKGKERKRKKERKKGSGRKRNGILDKFKVLIVQV